MHGDLGIEAGVTKLNVDNYKLQFAHNMPLRLIITVTQACSNFLILNNNINTVCAYVIMTC